MVNFRLSYYSLPSASPSSELRNSRAVKRKYDDFNSALADWACIYLSSIFTVRNALWYKKKASLIYIANCLNRGTDLNRLLISLSQITVLRCRFKICEVFERCDMLRSAWILWYIEYWWVPICVIWTYLLWWIKAIKPKIICFTGVYIL